MATLTETARVSRMVIRVVGGLLATMVLGRFAFDVFWKYWQAAHPLAPPPPTAAFGTLPPISFPQKPELSLTYSLETPNGDLPNFGDRAAVYLVPEQRPRFLALDQAIKEAGALGFTSAPEAQNEVVYRFRRTTPLPATLSMNVYTGKFALSVDWSQDPNFFVVKNIPLDNQAVVEVKAVLKKANLIPDDLTKGEAQITYLKATGGTYKQTVSLSEADFIRTDLYRMKVAETYEAVTADPQQGVVRAIVSGNADKGRVVQIEYNYYPIDYQNTSTYPVNTTQQAWLELTRGEGYVAQIDPGVDKVVIRRVELAYFDAFEPQAYFQPVYVFRGDDNFIAYVAAVSQAVPTGAK